MLLASNAADINSSLLSQHVKVPRTRVFTCTMLEFQQLEGDTKLHKQYVKLLVHNASWLLIMSPQLVLPCASHALAF